ncbi:hypothetical protein CDQ84_01950 [Clostridium thermosuccinogenes]|uniref:Glycoside hydrolase n=2 Tax=Clostridium thermosuccinogenes TaxID=84032 RepID=A0A2K2FLN0_9CLOT|nr:hypothetical protein CDO33_10870 [Pseudoclostridium thermosuccinogenes]PNT99689.1 hypothetical protein CDQ85_02385 [Pseudoclostridium thermosuccinogenes]PNU01177.1 hypothetical protein CDQ84_01950 [Pseudoclostridium thermosuccinogenes]
MSNVLFVTVQNIEDLVYIIYLLINTVVCCNVINRGKITMRIKEVKNILIKVIIFTMICLVVISTGISSHIYASERKFNMTYAYFGNSIAFSAYMEKAANSLNEIAPDYFGINEDGSLKLTTKLSSDFIISAQKKGIKVVPFISNHWDRELGRIALANRERLATQLANAVKQLNLDGVNVDLENLNEDDRDAYTDFVRLLREKLPDDKIVAVAVAVNPSNATKGWNASYDYAGLAKYSDYLMLMAYDEHYESGKEGPVASADFVEASIKYALKRVPSEKIVLGIAFYGRYWISGKSYGGYGISNSKVEALIKMYGGRVTYDYNKQSPKAVITIKPTDPAYYISGKKLEPGTYTFWYENEQSIKYKLTLVKKYNLKGTGSWSLGQETENTWKYYNLWLNGVYFTDAQDSWAREAILTATLKGWFKGVSSTQFKPKNYLTRAEAAAILVRALALEGTGDKSGFPDTAGHWAENDIIIAKEHGIIKGNEDGYYQPEAPISREQMAVMLERILETGNTKKSSTTQGKYWDVSRDESSWSYDAIMKMSQLGIFTGYPDGGFYPKEGISREQMAQLMVKMENYFTHAD